MLRTARKFTGASIQGWTGARGAVDSARRTEVMVAPVETLHPLRSCALYRVKGPLPHEKISWGHVGCHAASSTISMTSAVPLIGRGFLGTPRARIDFSAIRRN